MNNDLNVANYISTCIEASGKKQYEIAVVAGFDNPNIITMIKQGKTKLPIGKVGVMAKALEIDPIHLFKLCLSEYQPETYAEISPFMEEALTNDELKLVRQFRVWVGAPYLASLNLEQKEKLKSFLHSLQNQTNTQIKIH